MQLSETHKKQLENEFTFSASKSSGPGGQNVNKVNTQVELRFSIAHSAVFSENEKQTLRSKLKNRINLDDELILVAKAERSQLRNKQQVSETFFSIIEQALTPAKKRVKTKPTLASKRRRIERKKKQAQKKEWRKKPGIL
jgi:ribosome-associated protein